MLSSRKEYADAEVGDITLHLMKGISNVSRTDNIKSLSSFKSFFYFNFIIP